MILAIRAFRATIFAFNDAIAVAIAAFGSVTVAFAVAVTAVAGADDAVEVVAEKLTGPPARGAYSVNEAFPFINVGAVTANEAPPTDAVPTIPADVKKLATAESPIANPPASSAVIVRTIASPAV